MSSRSLGVPVGQARPPPPGLGWPPGGSREGGGRPASIPICAVAPETLGWTRPLSEAERAYLPAPSLRLRVVEETIEGLNTWRLDYEEVGRPTVVRQSGTGRDVPAAGSLWLDPPTGPTYSNFRRFQVATPEIVRN